MANIIMKNIFYLLFVLLLISKCEEKILGYTREESKQVNIISVVIF